MPVLHNLQSVITVSNTKQADGHSNKVLIEYLRSQMSFFGTKHSHVLLLIFIITNCIDFT